MGAWLGGFWVGRGASRKKQNGSGENPTFPTSDFSTLSIQTFCNPPGSTLSRARAQK